MDTLKGFFEKLKELWDALAPKVKTLIIIMLCLLIVGGITFIAINNSKDDEMTMLFPDIATYEASEIYYKLSELGIPATLDRNGKLYVPTELVNSILFQLQAEGLPKTTAPYGTYLDNVGLMTTSSQEKQIAIFGRQDEINNVLMTHDYIKNATTTISIPDNSSYILGDKSAETTAAVMITFEKDIPVISDVFVDTLKKIVAAGIGDCKAENVQIIDSSNNIELTGTQSDSVSYALKLFDYENMLAARAEDAIKKLYSPVYGAEGITVAASFTVDTDKMIQESKIFQPENTGTGVPVRDQESYTSIGNIPTGGIVGEEYNTDTIPSYLTEDGASGDNVKTWDKITDFETSYIMTQIEREAAPIKTSSITLLLDEANLTTALIDSIILQVARATGIDVASVAVGQLNLPFLEEEELDLTVPWYENTTILILLGIALFLVLLAIIIIPIIIARKKKRKQAAEEAEALLEQQELENEAAKAQMEVDAHKNKLLLEAEAQKINEGGFTEEIRAFASENPEMTAALVRSLLRNE